MKRRILAWVLSGVMTFSLAAPVYAETPAAVAEQTQLQAPKTCTIAQEHLALRLTWSKVAGAAGYELLRYQSTEKKWVQIYRGEDLRYVDQGVQIGRNYRYRVRAYAADGTPGAYQTTDYYQAVKLPGRVGGVKASAGEGTVKLTFSRVSGADGYAVYRATGSGKMTRIATTTQTSYTDKKLAHKVTYSYQVRAYRMVTQTTSADSTKRRIESPLASTTVKATPVVKNLPKAPSGLVARIGDRKVNLLWNKVSGADGYQVYRYDSMGKKNVLVRDLTSTSCNNGGLVLNREYRYTVYAYRAVGGVKYRSEQASNTVKVKATTETAATEKNADGVHSIRYTAKVVSTANQYPTASSTQKLGTIKVGTTLKVLYRQYRRAKVELPNGKICWVVNSNLSYQKTHYTTKDYSKAEKEYYINSEGYSSDTKYLIWISLYTQRVNIFEGSKGRWKLVRTARCASGTINKPTPVGSYKIEDRSAAGWDYGSYYVKPVVQFYGPYFFHSRLIYYKGGYKDATIGKPASAGCIRMYNEDINFIYDKMPRNTRVISY